MKLMATITPEQMAKIRDHIDCDQWVEIFEEEYVFYNPTERFRLIMCLFDIPTYSEPE